MPDVRIDYVFDGICMLCGDGVLNDGQHIDPERHLDAVRGILDDREYAWQAATTGEHIWPFDENNNPTATTYDDAHAVTHEDWWPSELNGADAVLVWRVKARPASEFSRV